MSQFKSSYAELSVLNILKQFMIDNNPETYIKLMYESWDPDNISDFYYDSYVEQAMNKFYNEDTNTYDINNLPKSISDIILKWITINKE